jgi:hypothetical protein
MNDHTITEVQQILHACVSNAIKRTKAALARESSPKPFHQALLTPEIVRISSFERSFSTSFGQGPIEQISQLLAKANGFETERQKRRTITLYKGAIDEVERIAASLRDGSRTPDWNREVRTVCAFDRGDTEARDLVSDLWLKKDNIEHYISIKTVKPNLDQTEVAKKDMLLLKANNSDYRVYLGLYYNPGGPLRSDYNHTMPMKIFDMHKDDCVLIGRDYWEFLGGEGTYDSLLEIFSEVGAQTKDMLLGL